MKELQILDSDESKPFARKWFCIGYEKSEKTIGAFHSKKIRRFGVNIGLLYLIINY